MGKKQNLRVEDLGHGIALETWDEYEHFCHINMGKLGLPCYELKKIAKYQFFYNGQPISGQELEKELERQQQNTSDGRWKLQQAIKDMYGKTGALEELIKEEKRLAKQAEDDKSKAARLNKDAEQQEGKNKVLKSSVKIKEVKLQELQTGNDALEKHNKNTKAEIENLEQKRAYHQEIGKQADKAIEQYQQSIKNIEDRYEALQHRVIHGNGPSITQILFGSPFSADGEKDSASIVTNFSSWNNRSDVQRDFEDRQLLKQIMANGYKMPNTLIERKFIGATNVQNNEEE